METRPKGICPQEAWPKEIWPKTASPRPPREGRPAPRLAIEANKRPTQGLIPLFPHIVQLKSVLLRPFNIPPAPPRGLLR